MTMDADRTHFYLRRLHSLAGVLPIGFYMLFHVYIANASVLAGPEVFDKMAESLESVPFFLLLTIEVLLIWLPIAFHGIYGLVIVREAQSNLTTYGYTRNAFYTLQRISGVVAFGFLAFHVYTTRFYNYLWGVPINHHTMQAWMADPFVFVLYIVGVLTSVFHLTNGVATFCITWGITVGARAQRAMHLACTVLFIAMGLTGMVIVAAFR